MIEIILSTLVCTFSAGVLVGCALGTLRVSRRERRKARKAQEELRLVSLLACIADGNVQVQETQGLTLPASIMWRTCDQLCHSGHLKPDHDDSGFILTEKGSLWLAGRGR